MCIIKKGNKVFYVEKNGAKKRTRPKVSGSPEGIQITLKKATSELMVLFMLRKKPMYSYELMNEISQRSDGEITFNTMYLTIYRLQEHEYIREHSKVMSEDNRTRIYFTITETGEAYLEEIMKGYRQYIQALERVLEYPWGGAPEENSDS